MVRAIQEALDPLCLAGVTINPEGRVGGRPGPGPGGPGPARLAALPGQGPQPGGRDRRPGARPAPTPQPQGRPSTGAAQARARTRRRPRSPTAGWTWPRSWTARSTGPSPGLPLEYRLIRIYSRDAGRREAKIRFDAGQGTQDLGFRGDLDVLFTCEPAVSVTLDVRDADGRPTTASFLFRDAPGPGLPVADPPRGPRLLVPPPGLPAVGRVGRPGPGDVHRRGDARAGVRGREADDRGPAGPATHRESFELKRWIHLAKLGWFSGDHHVHAAGCGHYERPTEGVRPEDMMRHILGEDLDVGCVLSWGPCWYAQKAYLRGQGPPALDPRDPDALRRRGLRLPLLARRATSACSGSRRTTTRGPRRSRNGRAGTCRS